MKESSNPEPTPPAYGGEPYPVYVPEDGDGDSVSPVQIQRFFRFLRRFWWMPLVTTVVKIGRAHV